MAAPCNHEPTSYPALTSLLQTPTARTVIQSVVTHLQSILDEDTCTACAVESGVRSASAGVTEVKRLKKEEKGQRVGWFGGWGERKEEGVMEKVQGSESGKGVWEREGWDKKTVKAAGKEMKGLVRGVRAEGKGIEA